MIFIVLNFTLAGVLLTIGVLTLKKVSHAGEWVFASLPLLFGLHQFDQGIVWLGLLHVVDTHVLHVAAQLFVFYAQAVLPVLVPLAVWLLEARGPKRDLLASLVLIGALLAVYVGWGLAHYPTQVYVHHVSLVYANASIAHLWIALLYILTTCGSLILSRSVTIQLFGWLNLIGLVVVYLIAQYAFTALWCLYAALVSGMLYLYFIERRIAFLSALRRTEVQVEHEVDDELARLTRHLPRLRRLLVRPH
ncbi:hypothetical protein BJI67_04965 [Acidihalobacter aeolianus]|uniref:Uncharacterized protein n=1 Tax=Acidihalobacter aeolianus TaxID=2792603 RepID=A0A1D8K6D7_9GAMM|nr:DUF6629 family protein [Acidihalobacter aeolianus]AOV16508.1 hypothetical protein BJI67_04965 [Acidihalobacter aeolianus]